jgi:putative SOS response-associated peptidase YedK
MNFKIWRTIGAYAHAVYVMIEADPPEGPEANWFTRVPESVRRIGVWTGYKGGPISGLDPLYRKMLARQGFVVLSGLNHAHALSRFNDRTPSYSVEAMCNAYSMTKTRDALRGLFKVSDNRIPEIVPRAQIWPFSTAPVVRLDEDGEREIVDMTFAFPLLREGLAPKPVSNIRDDKAMKIWFWRESFNKRRCLVPATSYCDPDSGAPVRWHWFALLNGASDAHGFAASALDERPLFACPGVWKPYEGLLRKKDPPVKTDVFAFMTTTPNQLTASINHERMPVIFTEPEQFDIWLNGTPEEAHALVSTFPAERMRIVQSGPIKKDLLGAEPETTV